MIFLAHWHDVPKKYGGTSGGVQHFIEISKRLLRDGQELHVLTNKAGHDLLKIKEVNARISVFNTFDEGLCQSNLGVAFSYVIRTFAALLYSAYLPRDFDLVCATSDYLPDLVTSALMSKISSLSHRPIVYLHGPLLLYPTERRSRFFLSNILGWLSQRISLTIIELFNFHIFATPFAIIQLRKMKLELKCEIDTIYNGVDFEFIKKLTPTDGKYDASFLGGLTPRKGIFDLIDIWDKVCDEMPEVKLAVIGAGLNKYTAEMKERISKRGLEDNISLLGFLSEREKFAVLKGSKVFVFPSRNESWGIVICEAIACGLPVIVYDLLAYSVFGNAIIKVPIGDTSAFAHATLNLLTDKRLRREVGTKAENTASHFDWNRMAKEEIALFKNLSRA